MDNAHKSNFTETIEHASSNVTSYDSLAICRRRNERRVRHGNIYDIIWIVLDVYQHKTQTIYS
jgi:hypothetical protein